MKGSVSSLIVLVVGVVLVAAVTVLQGQWTDRWSGRNVKEELAEAGRLLESRFPVRFGDWEFVRELESDPKQLERAGAVGHVSRLYRNVETGDQVSAFVVCATPHDASGHTPDRCYPGAGFEIAEAEHRQSIPLDDGRSAETFTGTFRKTGQTLRVFWTYGIADKPADGNTAADPAGKAHALRWVAPQIARIALNGEPYVYKLYAIVDQTRLGGTQATLEASRFIADLLPAFDAGLAAKPQAESEEKSAAAEPGAAGQPG